MKFKHINAKSTMQNMSIDSFGSISYYVQLLWIDWKLNIVIIIKKAHMHISAHEFSDHTLNEIQLECIPGLYFFHVSSLFFLATAFCFLYYVIGSIYKKNTWKQILNHISSDGQHSKPSTCLFQCSHIEIFYNNIYHNIWHDNDVQRRDIWLWTCV